VLCPAVSVSTSGDRKPFLLAGKEREKERNLVPTTMATVGLMRTEEEFCTSFFDGETTIESKIQALEDIGATKQVNRYGTNQPLLLCLKNLY
jgi:hypothetical protein